MIDYFELESVSEGSFTFFNRANVRGQGIVVIIHLLIDAFQSRRQTGQNGRFSKN